jgi:hypothetical protein
VTREEKGVRLREQPETKTLAFFFTRGLPKKMALTIIASISPTEVRLEIL